jgi:basic membrane protein A
LRSLKKLVSTGLILAMTCSIFVGCGSKPAGSGANSKESKDNGSKLKKIALVINGPVSDGGWNSNAWKGLEMAKEKYGCEIAVSENVKQADYESAFREYANQGYDLIVANGFEFTDAIKTVALEFPDVKFAIINGGYSANNISSLVFDQYLCGYLAGSLAGYMTKTNAIGFVGGQEIPSIVDALEGLKGGLAKANPNAKVVSTMADSWEDMVKGKEIALSQITSANVDIMFSVASSVDTGVIDGAKEKGKYVIGQPNDKLDSAPGTVIASVLSSTPDLVMLAASDVATGQFKGEPFLGNLENGVIKLGRFGKEVPQDIVDKMNQLVEDIKSGKVKIK